MIDTYTVEAIVLKTDDFGDGNVTLHPMVASNVTTS